MISERIAKADCAAGFMLDGFPRTEPQAAALGLAMSNAGVALDAVVLIEVPDSLIVERITGRRTDPEAAPFIILRLARRQPSSPRAWCIATTTPWRP